MFGQFLIKQFRSLQALGGVLVVAAGNDEVNPVSFSLSAHANPKPSDIPPMPYR